MIGALDSKKRKLEEVELTDLIPKEFVTKKRSSINLVALDPKFLLDIPQTTEKASTTSPSSSEKNLVPPTPSTFLDVRTSHDTVPLPRSPSLPFAAVGQQPLPRHSPTSSPTPPEIGAPSITPANSIKSQPVGRRWSLPALPALGHLHEEEQRRFAVPFIRKDVYNPNYSCDSYPFRRTNSPPTLANAIKNTPAVAHPNSVVLLDLTKSQGKTPLEGVDRSGNFFSERRNSFSFPINSQMQPHEILLPTNPFLPSSSPIPRSVPSSNVEMFNPIMKMLPLSPQK